MKINAFILAAGLGERLRPLTESIPKPLLPLFGRPVLDRIIERISALNPEKIGINLHHRAFMIKEWLDRHPLRYKIDIFYEYPLYGTGGALKNAEFFLRESTFIVHNSDIITDTDLKGLLDFHFSSRNIGTLVVHNYPRFNNLVVSNGLLKGLSSCGIEGKLMAFTGIAIYEPEFLRLLPLGYSSVTEAWLKAIEYGYSVGVYDITGAYWSDIGTPESYAKTIYELLKIDGESLYISSSVCTDHVEMKGFVSIESGVKLKKGISLRNALVLNGEVSGSIENAITGYGFTLKVKENGLFSLPYLIGTGGSDRRYYRLGDGRVLMESEPDDPEFKRYIEYSRFFFEQGIRVARLLNYNEEKNTAFFEDLGDISLYSWLKGKRDRYLIEDMYKKVLDILVQIHAIMPDESTPSFRVFDYEHFRWETGYFTERFLRPIAGIDIDRDLEREFHELALIADSYPKRLIHRDFQSQNIMIKNEIPYIIDYQGSRIGPPGYDLASLLWDPYYRLEDVLREKLIKYYIERAEIIIPDFNKELFIESLPVMKLQRHMQALGAYGFLSMVKGKKYFMKHVPEALRLLREDIVTLKERFKNINRMIERINFCIIIKHTDYQGKET
ncbi:MAG: phosphotransferase [Thermodesulfovibrionales bacterium]|nr:phosphotransferase [Thermodesulfovibrionales bacterium]